MHVCSPNMRLRMLIWRTTNWKTRRSFFRGPAHTFPTLANRCDVPVKICDHPSVQVHLWSITITPTFVFLGTYAFYLLSTYFLPNMDSYSTASSVYDNGLISRFNAIWFFHFYFNPSSIMAYLIRRVLSPLHGKKTLQSHIMIPTFISRSNESFFFSFLFFSQFSFL